MKTRTGCSQQRGFTLLELLLTMAILVLIVGIMGSAFQLSVRSWEKGEEHVEKFRRTRIVMDLVAQQVKSFYPYLAQEEEKQFIAFEGTAQSLKFVSPQSLQQYVIAGLKWVQYFVEDGEEGKTLVVQESTVTGKDFLGTEAEPLEEGTGIPLLQGLVNLTFEYYVVTYDEEGNPGEGEWLEEWSWKDKEGEEEDGEGMSTLEAIKITIEEKSEAEEDGEAITTAMTIPLVVVPREQMAAAAARGQIPGDSGVPPDGFVRRPHDAPF